MRTCHRGEPERLGNPASQCAIAVQTNFAPPGNSFAPPPGAKLFPFCPTMMRQPLTHNRLARARWGETRRISLHEKKKKISVVQKP
jgi:hypothetical protein